MEHYFFYRVTLIHYTPNIFVGFIKEIKLLVIGIADVNKLEK
jgi:hypothetical protein